MATTNTRFVYSRLWPEGERFIPDKTNPVVFKMWKLRGADRLVLIDQRFRLHLSEFPASFDFLTGKLVSSGGNIRLQLTRSQGEVSERTLQDWSVTVEVPGGGLIETDPAAARVVYELPTTGYLPAYTYTMSAETHTWQGALKRMFYVRTREGNLYAKLNVEVLINHHPEDTVRVDLRGELNPSGSPNFEADAAAMVLH